MAELDTYLFDLDGTLIDSIELILASYRHTFRVHQKSAPGDEAWIKGIGTPLRTQLRAFTDDPAEIEAMLATYREHNLAHHDEMVRAYPGVRDALDRLAERGAAVAVVTSKLTAGVERGLRVAGLTRYFDVLVSADDVQYAKPHPEPVFRALELLDRSPDRAVFIGDSPHDLAAGRAAGVRTAAALWGAFTRGQLRPHQPDYWLTQPTEMATFATTA